MKVWPMVPILALVGCAAPRSANEGAAGAAGIAAIRATLDELYRAFCFDAGGEPDWSVQRELYLEGAAFVPPARAGARTSADGTEAFLDGFATFAATGAYADTGLHERIVGTRIDVFGGVAHAWVAFDGVLPGTGEVVTRGLDSIALARDGDVWKVASFATQYETEELALPARFLDGAQGDNR